MSNSRAVLQIILISDLGTSSHIKEALEFHLAEQGWSKIVVEVVRDLNQSAQLLAWQAAARIDRYLLAVVVEIGPAFIEEGGQGNIQQLRSWLDDSDVLLLACSLTPGQEQLRRLLDLPTIFVNDDSTDNFADMALQITQGLPDLAAL